MNEQEGQKKKNETSDDQWTSKKCNCSVLWLNEEMKEKNAQNCTETIAPAKDKVNHVYGFD